MLCETHTVRLGYLWLHGSFVFLPQLLAIYRHRATKRYFLMTQALVTCCRRLAGQKTSSLQKSCTLTTWCRHLRTLTTVRRSSKRNLYGEYVATCICSVICPCCGGPDKSFWKILDTNWIRIALHYVNAIRIERFSIECRKTKTKVITLANHRRHRQSSEPIKTRSNYMKLTQRAGKRMRVSRDWFWFTSDWLKKWRDFFKPIVWRTKRKTNCFSTLKWKPL